MSIENQTSKIFNEFPKYKPMTAAPEIRRIENNEIKNEVKIETAVKKQTKKKILFGSTLASSIISVGVVAMVVGKGFHGSGLKKIQNSLNKNLANNALTGTKKGINTVLDKLQAVSNFTALKDFLADKVLRKTKYGTKFADGCAIRFGKIADKAMAKKYDKVNINVKNFTSLADYIGKKYNTECATSEAFEFSKELTSKVKSLESAFDDGFGLGARKIRDNKRSDLISDVKDKIAERFFGEDKGFLNIKNYSKYVTEDVTSDAKSVLEDEISTARKRIFNDNADGILDEIVTMLKTAEENAVSGKTQELVSDEEMKELLKLADKIKKTLSNAAKSEKEEYFLKKAEIKVGSAPTDIVSVLMPVGVGAYSVAKGDDKDEKISATLTTCIPLVGSFATFVYGASKMYFGAKNLLLSLGSGIILNKTGAYLDGLHKKYKSEGSFVKIAKDEYDNLVSGFNAAKKTLPDNNKKTS